MSAEPGLIEESIILVSELDCLTNIQDNIQYQLDNKLPISFSKSDDANKVVVTNSSKTIITSSITTTELNCLSGISSNIQDQLNTKAGTDSPNFTGTPTAPTPSLEANNPMQIANIEFVNKSIISR